VPWASDGLVAGAGGRRERGQGADGEARGGQIGADVVGRVDGEVEPPPAVIDPIAWVEDLQDQRLQMPGR
jgi:hypothetical protein